MRLVGARPLDEAVIMDAAFRRTAYQAADTSRMEALGAAVKNAIRGGQQPSDEQMATFISKYAAAGGYPTNFAKSILDWTKDANTSVANSVFLKMQTPAIKNQQVVMGGKMLPDYSVAKAPGGITAVQAPTAGGTASIQAAGTQIAQPDLTQPQQ